MKDKSRKINNIARHVLALSLVFFVFDSFETEAKSGSDARPRFEIQSIDTMKFSRDLAREKMNDPAFDAVIDRQMKQVKDAGATHVAIDTPYDEEFIPMLERWVKSARKHGLAVFFRGNFAGWEEWFGYKRITRSEHEALLRNFLGRHHGLFEDGDVFSPCPECENGGPGDPRMTGDYEGYVDFLVYERKIARKELRRKGKRVIVYPSMNFDVANMSFDRTSMRRIGGVLLIDHYVLSPERFGNDIDMLVKKFGGKIGIGEFGAPIPDIHGELTGKEQAEIVGRYLEEASVRSNKVPLMNYWVLEGGTTTLVDPDGAPREAYKVIQDYFTL